MSNILYLDVDYSVQTWQVKYDFEIGGHTKKRDKTNKKSKGLQSQGNIENIRMNYFPRRMRSDDIYQPLRSGRIWHKVNEKWYNRNFEIINEISN